jgi:hypothetical protein
VLAGYAERRAVFEAERRALEARFATLAPAHARTAFQACWDEHRQVLPAWIEQVRRDARAPARRVSAFGRYWAAQSRLDRVP